MSHNREDLFRLVAALSDGEVHSGESLGRLLGVTRAAVWKRLQQLDELGLATESVKGQGYRLATDVALIDSAKLASGLSESSRSLLTELVYLFEVDSTNQYLLERESRHGVVCIAERQTAGRGRRGRQWISPFATNIYLSVRWHFDRGVVALEGLSLAIGVVLAEVLEGMGLTNVQLKWPNDILYNHAKLGGILVDVGGDLTGECSAIIGIGLNVDMGRKAVPGIEQAWTDLASAGVRLERIDLCMALLDKLLPALDSYQDESFRSYKARWNAHAAFLNQEVSLISPAGSRRGVLQGVNDQGALIFVTAEGVEWVNGGEISLRLAEKSCDL